MRLPPYVHAKDACSRVGSNQVLQFPDGRKAPMMKVSQVTVILTALVPPLAVNSQQSEPMKPVLTLNPARIAEVAVMLADKPTCFGRPITDRAAWETLAATEEGKAAIRAAEALLSTPMPEMTDDIFLTFSRTGSRTEGDRVGGLRRGRIGTLTKAELLENSGRFIPELEKTIRSLCEERTWVGVAHDHNDVGSYIVVLDDQTLIEDPGAEAYTARTFSPRRYESNVLNSFGHSVPLAAGKMQDEGAQVKAVVLRTDFTDSQDTLVFDIRSAYSVPQLERLTRTYVFSRKYTGSMTVTDEIAFSEPSDFETALITLSPWRQITPKTLRIGDEGKAIDVQIDTGGLAFSIIPAEIDEHIHTKTLPVRLGIRLDSLVRQATVTVKITPAQ